MYYLTQSVHRNAQIRGNQIATINGERSRTWAEVKNRVACFAGALQSIGVTEGDNVAILSLNSDRYFEFYYAVPWAGACVVPLNIRWSAPENAYSLKDAGVKTLLVDDTFAKMVPALLEHEVALDTIIYLGDDETPEGMLNYEELIGTYRPIEDASRNNDDIAGIFYTGGTTGFPKGVMLSHSNIWSNTVTLMGLMGLKDESRVLFVAPMFHMAAEAVLQCGMMAGATLVFVPAFTPPATIRAIQEKQITHTALVPVMIQMIVNDPSVKEADLSSLEFVVYGGSPITEAVLKKALETVPKAQFAQVYGQTELAPLTTYLTPKYHVVEGPNSGKLKSAGQAATLIEVKIMDENGDEVPQGEIGEIIARGPNAMLGYWNKPEETAQSLRNGWIFTGDAGYMDEHGFVFLVDRIKDMIVTGGENVYSAETENATSKHPAVDQVIVIGIPSEEWGEQVHAEIILKQGMSATKEEIIATAKEHIAGYKCPRSITFRTEPFPLSGAGKILKREVRKTYWEDASRNIK